jgi:hypothetical protein
MLGAVKRGVVVQTGAYVVVDFGAKYDGIILGEKVKRELKLCEEVNIVIKNYNVIGGTYVMMLRVI